MKLVQIPIENLDASWPLVREHIASACERSNGRFSEETTYALCASGHWQLWVVWDDVAKKHMATITTKISEFPTGMVAGEIIICTGVERNRWIDLLDDLEEWARANGAEVMQTLARKGWVKNLPSYFMSHVMLEKRI